MEISGEEKVVTILDKNNDNGLTITELVKMSALSRSTVRVALARLEGANKVNIRIAGMAKIYSLVGGDGEQ
jgi:predicted transcriptional regulator